ncbi:hypothetical protein ACROYT_G044715 [Oculina patagonica]
MIFHSSREISVLYVMENLKVLIFIILGLSLDISQVKAVDGGYSDWSECSECSVTCGGGTQTFSRTCTNPPPSDGGRDCSGLGGNVKSEECNQQECLVDGGYTEWSISECSVTCGGGTQTLTRTCTNPSPSNGGKDCSELGPDEKTISCSEQECPVDGGYTDWLKCSQCSVTCGGGTQTLTRTCTNPPPSNGGKDCSALGPAKRTFSCNEVNCPPPCKAGLDIAIVLDKSKSVRIGNLKKVFEFLEQLVNMFDPAPDADHFGFITFNKNAYTVFDFDNFKTQEKAAILKKIDEEPLKLNYQTRTDLALKMARDELFTEEGGDRPDKPNIMFVFTDGKPTQPKLGELDFEAFANDIAKDFKAKGVYTVAVGIGREVDEHTLQLIAGEGNPVVMVDTFDQLQDEIETIKSSACSD